MPLSSKIQSTSFSSVCSYILLTYWKLLLARRAATLLSVQLWWSQTSTACFAGGWGKEWTPTLSHQHRNRQIPFPHFPRRSPHGRGLGSTPSGRSRCARWSCPWIAQKRICWSLMWGGDCGLLWCPPSTQCSFFLLQCPALPRPQHRTGRTGRPCRAGFHRDCGIRSNCQESESAWEQFSPIQRSATGHRSQGGSFEGCQLFLLPSPSLCGKWWCLHFEVGHKRNLHFSPRLQCGIILPNQILSWTGSWAGQRWWSGELGRIVVLFSLFPAPVLDRWPHPQHLLHWVCTVHILLRHQTSSCQQLHNKQH